MWSATAKAGLPPLHNTYHVNIPCPSEMPLLHLEVCSVSVSFQQSVSSRSLSGWSTTSSSRPPRFPIGFFLPAKTGSQPFGIHVRPYEPHTEVPRSIKAVAEAIHGPPQEGEVDGLTQGLG
ncbi:hypothetical protein CALVIDRAFT_35194 [Calocera viscosa TUFC12733]|uniref:Nuclear pore localisation protein NPL4 C-terminal domain-containing protein n=1 Tax=Calocera viscosa (strain TUFC12733) TaxID=1330018 RepID=A0A167FN92_CALVF|nr:hypothetical protein CALVIDRAFT_35194 [Calocera viscosa TUFC12733]